VKRGKNSPLGQRGRFSPSKTGGKNLEKDPGPPVPQNFASGKIIPSGK